MGGTWLLRWRFPAGRPDTAHRRPGRRLRLQGRGLLDAVNLSHFGFKGSPGLPDQFWVLDLAGFDFLAAPLLGEQPPPQGAESVGQGIVSLQRTRQNLLLLAVRVGVPYIRSRIKCDRFTLNQ